MRALGLLFGIAFGFVMAWARLSDPAVVRRMLLLAEADVPLLMGSAVVVAALGHWLLKRRGARSVAGAKPMDWRRERPEPRHIVGSAIFGAGWSVAATCPGPVAVMIGEGRIGGVFVGLGLVVGALLHGTVWKRNAEPRLVSSEAPGVVGL